jgi:hypothetical protein
MPGSEHLTSISIGPAESGALSCQIVCENSTLYGRLSWQASVLPPENRKHRNHNLTARCSFVSHVELLEAEYAINGTRIRKTLETTLLVCPVPLHA